MPDLMTNSGLVPKNAGLNMVRSAILPTLIRADQVTYTAHNCTESREEEYCER